MSLPLLVKRFWVLSPSVSRIMYFFSRGSVAGFASVRGAAGDKVAQPQTAPIVTFVLPTGVTAWRVEANVHPNDRRQDT